MTQTEFLNELKIHLSKIPKDEQERIFEYYSEIINDKIEDGKKEEQVVSELGSPEQVAQSVIEGYSETKNKNRKKRSIGAIIGFSALIPFVLIMLIVWGALVFTFILSSAVLVIGGILYFISSFIVLCGGFSAGLFQMGIGFFCFGLGIFAGFGSIYFGKLYLNITKRIFKKYISVYGGAANE